MDTVVASVLGKFLQRRVWWTMEMESMREIRNHCVMLTAGRAQARTACGFGLTIGVDDRCSLNFECLRVLNRASACQNPRDKRDQP